MLTCALLGALVVAAPADATIYGPERALPFAGLTFPLGVAVDQAGDVFAADDDDVLELPAGSGTQVTLPFTGLSGPAGVAVDQAGDVFVADPGNNRVLELPAGTSTQVTLPFTGLSINWVPAGDVGVDQAGDVFVADTGNGRVLELRSGTTTAVTVPFSELSAPTGIAVDGFGDLFVADVGGTLFGPPPEVWELPVGGVNLINFRLTPQTIIYGDPAPRLGAVANSGLPVTFAVLSGPCSLGSQTGAQALTITGAGQCVVQASQAGNAAYPPAAPVTQTLTITPAATTLTAPAVKAGFLQATFSATLTSQVTGQAIAGQPVSFSVHGSTWCTATSNTTGTATCTAHRISAYTLFGQTTFTAGYAGATDYQSSSTTATLTGLFG